MNIEAALQELDKIKKSHPHESDDDHMRLKVSDMRRILTAMKTPEAYVGEHCVKGKVAHMICHCDACENEKKEQTLAEKDIYQEFKNKVKSRCCNHGEIVECSSCMRIKELAIEHFSPLIEKARKEGIFEGHKQSQHLSFMDGKRQSLTHLKEQFRTKPIQTVLDELFKGDV